MGDKTTSPPSSPPVAASPTMSTTTRKRSREEMNRTVNDVPESSSTVVPDLEYLIAPNTQDNQDSSDSWISKPSAQSKPMGPPPLPSNTASQKPPGSGQGSAPSAQTPRATGTAAKQEATLPPSKQQYDAEGSRSSCGEHGAEDDAERTDSPTSDSEPQDQIDAFDWSDLQLRYHAKMGELDAQEEKIMNEFNGLCDESFLTLSVEL